MTLALPLFDRPGDYIGGQFRPPSASDGELVIRGPADQREHISTHSYAAAQLDQAVDAARSASAAWRRLGEPARRALLLRYQEELRAQRDAITLAIALEVGKPLWEAKAEVDAMIAKVELSLGEGARFTSDQRIDDLPGEIRFRPLGVLAVIGPFNFPGHLPNGQIVPALLLGNCVVHKPSEKTPSAGHWIARCMHAAGIPKGVFNLVQGPAASGATLSVHPGVDGVLFTGSAAVGQRIVRDNAAHPERLIALELGGKNAAIVLDDCDLERSARAIAFAAFATAGQRCSSTSRVFATPGVIEPLGERLGQLARMLRVGHPLDTEVFMGPVISQPARDALLSAQARACAAGFEAVAAGGALSLPPREGFYVRPAVHRAPSFSMVDGYTDTELFGPDLAIYPASTLEAAIEAANRSRFGLAASVFTASREAFETAADELRVGVLHWNRPSAGASSRLPFSGIKESGNHRPAGITAGTSCAFPQAVLLGGGPDSALPEWPGLRP